MTCGSVVPTSTMSGRSTTTRSIAWWPSDAVTTRTGSCGERQRDHSLNGDVVVGEQERAHTGLLSGIGASRSEQQRPPSRGAPCGRAHTRARALAVMKSMICCIGVPGRKMPLMPMAFSFGDVDVGNDAADHDLHVVQALLLQQLHHARADVHVRARQNRQADDVGVFLQRRRRRSARASGAGRCRSLPCRRRAARAQSPWRRDRARRDPAWR